MNGWGRRVFLPWVDFLFFPSCAKSGSIIGEDSADKNTPDSWSASVFRIIQTSGRRRIKQTPTRFDITTADVTGNVLRFKEGYLNKSHYLYAEAVFTSEEKRRKSTKSECAGKKEWMTKGRRIDEGSEQDVKWCLTEMRNKEGGAECWGDMIIDSRQGQINFHS